jgi:hypothetical protein
MVREYKYDNTHLSLVPFDTGNNSSCGNAYRSYPSYACLNAAFANSARSAHNFVSEGDDEDGAPGGTPELVKR